MKIVFVLSLVLVAVPAWTQTLAEPLAVSPVRLTFIARSSREAAVPQRVSLKATKGDNVPWRAETSAPWLHVGPAAGRGAAGLTISVDTGSLAEGTHRGRVAIVPDGAAGAPAVVEVVVEIAPPQAAAPPTSVPDTSRPEPPAQTPTAPVAPAAAPTVARPASDIPGRLTVAGQLPAATRNLPYSQAIPVKGGKPPYAVRLTQGRLPPGLRIAEGAVSGVARQTGNYAFVVAVTDASKPAVTVVQQVALRVVLLYPDTALTVNPPSIGLVTAGSRKASAQLTVTSGRQALDWRTAVDVPWMRITPAGGRGQTLVQIDADPAGLGPGVYVGTLTISMDGVPNTPARIPVQFTVRR
jgi:hypothetical protein